jgi:acyl dehydratase
VFATKVAGYPTVFAHGMLSMGATGRMLTNWVGDGRLTKYGVRFVSQVWPGDSLTARAKVEAIRDENGQRIADLSVVTVNQDGKEVVSGYASARLDP